MAVGITSNTQKRTLNLTQLRKNTRKRPDKTSGRKRPRLDDIDVVAADDHDSEQTAQLHAAVNVVAESAADNGNDRQRRRRLAPLSVSDPTSAMLARLHNHQLGSADVAEL